EGKDAASTFSTPAAVHREFCSKCGSPILSRRTIAPDVIRVRFLYRLRDEKKFASRESLKAQIDKDVARAENYFERGGARHMLSIL
ncbi:MAG: riboflavin kinase, partial [Acidobacteriota bacterium]